MYICEAKLLVMEFLLKRGYTQCGGGAHQQEIVVLE